MATGIMACKFVVAEGRSVLNRRNVLLNSGAQIDNEMQGAAWIEDAVNTKFIVPVDRAAYEAATATGKVAMDTQRSDAQNTQALNTDIDMTIKPNAQVPVTVNTPASPPLSIDTGAGVQTSSTPTAQTDPARTAPSPWTLDPESLKDKKLAELNVMVYERDPKVTPFSTKDEARAFLSKDFKRTV